MDGLAGRTTVHPVKTTKMAPSLKTSAGHISVTGRPIYFMIALVERKGWIVEIGG